jgi:hypothetical protein
VEEVVLDQTADKVKEDQVVVDQELIMPLNQMVILQVMELMEQLILAVEAVQQQMCIHQLQELADLV